MRDCLILNNELGKLNKRCPVSDEKKSEEGMKFKDVKIRRGGDQITLPVGMSYKEGREWLSRQEKAEEETVNVFEPIQGFVLDGALAFMKALEVIYGFVAGVAEMTFFGPRPPMMVQIQTGISSYSQVAWGNVVIPGIEGQLKTGFTKKDGQYIFVIQGSVKRKNLPDVERIAAATRDWLKENSVYRGKAIKLAFSNSEEFDINDSPRFFDVSGVREEGLIFPKDIQSMVDVNVFTPIEHSAACRDNRIPLKRGVLLEGPYGTGKTLLANVAAKKAVRHGWTFIYLSSVRDLKRAIHFAAQYQPAVIFAEDIDQVLKGERDEEVNDILNTIDGVEMKTSEIMVVLTTNFASKIDKAMIRPGRLDAVISVRAPDAEAVQRLIRLYGGNLITAKEDLREVGVTLDGQIPAIIREVVERAKLSAVRRTSTDGTKLGLQAEDLLIAAKTMTQHLALLREEVEDERSDEEKAATILSAGITTAAKTLLDTTNFASKSAPKGKSTESTHTA